MSRLHRPLGRLLLVVGLCCTPALARAGQPGSRGIATQMPAAEVARWQQQLDAAWQELVDARVRLERAQAAITRARAHHRARGQRKVELYAELDTARRELAEARRRWPLLVEEARRAGLPRGILADYDDRL